MTKQQREYIDSARRMISRMEMELTPEAHTDWEPDILRACSYGSAACNAIGTVISDLEGTL